MKVQPDDDDPNIDLENGNYRSGEAEQYRGLLAEGDEPEVLNSCRSQPQQIKGNAGCSSDAVQVCSMPHPPRAAFLRVTKAALHALILRVSKH